MRRVGEWVGGRGSIRGEVKNAVAGKERTKQKRAFARLLLLFLPSHLDVAAIFGFGWNDDSARLLLCIFCFFLSSPIYCKICNKLLLRNTSTEVVSNFNSVFSQFRKLFFSVH
jgi:hypothetical protein